MSAEGVQPPRCLYKVTKISRQLQPARKNWNEIPMLYAGLGEAMTGYGEEISP